MHLSPDFPIFLRLDAFVNMLINTFCHIPRLGEKAEVRLWSAGYRTWQDLRTLPAGLVRGFSAENLNRHLDASRAALERRDARYFADLLPAPQDWRLFAEFSGESACLDIETDGAGASITAITLFDGSALFSYVNGRNLRDFPSDIRKYALIVTFNGKCFDIPLLERYFRITIPQAHLDLRFLLRRLGIRGGLKRCEEQLSVSRGLLEGLDGYSAVLLWQEYLRRRDERFLDTLLAYNAEDVLHLPALMVYAYNAFVRLSSFPEKTLLPATGTVTNPYRPDPEVVAWVRSLQTAGRFSPIFSRQEAYV